LDKKTKPNAFPSSPLSLISHVADSSTASDLLILRTYETGGGFMRTTQWLLLGAVLLGFAVGLYLLFFCPAECQ